MAVTGNAGKTKINKGHPQDDPFDLVFFICPEVPHTVRAASAGQSASAGKGMTQYQPEQGGRFMDYKALAGEIIRLIGGTENIRQLTLRHALRLEFYDRAR
ncbi:MAG: hypothetical protein ACLUOI_26980 [Eisenbergiella sp.]